MFVLEINHKFSMFPGAEVRVELHDQQARFPGLIHVNKILEFIRFQDCMNRQVP